MKPFRERNPVLVGAVSLAILGAMLAAAFRADQLPLVGGGTTYYAEFSEAGGLSAGDDVRVAGVKVGEVDEITLDGDTVRVAMVLDEDVDLGSDPAASIRVKTLLGALVVAVEPSAGDEIAAGETIPLDRTTPPYDPVEAFSDLATTTGELDGDQLAEAFEAIDDATTGTAPEFRGTVRGLTRLSQNIADRDEQLGELLRNLETVSGTLADRNDELITLFDDGSQLFRALSSRRDAISDVLDATTTISDELDLLVEQSGDDIGPALRDLRRVTAVLQRNRDNLDQALETMPAFFRLSAGQAADGPFLDQWLPGFVELINQGAG